MCFEKNYISKIEMIVLIVLILIYCCWCQRVGRNNNFMSSGVSGQQFTFADRLINCHGDFLNFQLDGKNK